MTFEEYLLKKKIDAVRFKSDDNPTWEKWHVAFEQQHPDSFTAQKLYHINTIRRRFPLS